MPVHGNGDPVRDNRVAIVRRVTGDGLSGCGILKAGTLRESGFDPQAVGGFAFGLGLERLAMLKLGIDDIRKLWQPPYVPTSKE